MPMGSKGSVRNGFLRLGGVVCYFDPFAVDDGFGDRVLDGELLVLEVDGIPFQAHDLLSSQSVIGSHRHREFQRRSFHLRQKKLVRFLN